ncbi:MAG: DUF1801 domain-containing protein [Gammaproteobacteria bacterium]|nr:DUF1801 domain-containing protein [Gammaproteobacteria bacterium]
MPENKTKPNDASVEKFLSQVDDVKKREDTQTIVDMMGEITGYSATMWGPSIIGFGKYSYKYKSGHSGEWAITGVSPRARNISVYIMPGFGNYEDLMSRLGKHKTGKSCLYINRLSDVNTDVLRELISKSVDYMKEKYEIVS